VTVSAVVVSNVADLLGAIWADGTRQIVVSGRIGDVTTLRPAPGQVLQGEDDEAALVFVAGTDGVQLTRENQIHALHIAVSPDWHGASEWHPGRARGKNGALRSRQR
jgi:hypothetical protein